MARKKRVPTPERAGLRQDVRKAIERAFPENVVEMLYSNEDGETWFSEVEESLGEDLRTVNGVALFCERGPDERSCPAGYYFDDDEDDEEWPPERDNSRSYHLYFLSPAGKDFQFETETEDCYVEPADGDEYSMEEPEWETERVAGQGRLGWSVAVSMVAPFAVIALSESVTYENGEVRPPGIERCGEAGDGMPLADLEAALRERLGARAFDTLIRLRAKLADVLNKHGIAVLPEEEWRKPVPWLSPGEEVFAGPPDGPVRVLDAFFFEML